MQLTRFCMQIIFSGVQDQVSSHRPSLMVLADDLSGAAECAAAFASPRHPIRLQLAQEAGISMDAVTVWDLNAREAEATLSSVLVARLRRMPVSFIKVDSLLRGSWAQLLAQLSQAVDRPIVLCPALPRLGRAVREGRIRLSLRERQRIGSDRHGHAIVPALTARGLSASNLTRMPEASLAAFAASIADAAAKQAVTVVDAADADELDRLASALAQLSMPLLLCGSAGLLNAVARLQPGSAAGSTPCAFPGSARLPVPMAVLVGSVTPTARAQLERLRDVAATELYHWNPATGWSPGATRGATVGEPPAAAAPLRLFATASHIGASCESRSLPLRFVRARLPYTSDVRCFVATGGETARALCDLLGVAALDVIGELEDGVCVARLPGQPERLLILKSGSFGDDDTLVRLARLGPLTETEYRT